MKKILEYQKIDNELVQLTRELESSKEHEVISSMSSLYKELQGKLLSIEKQAEKLNKDYDDALKDYEKSMKISKNLSEQGIEKLNDDELTENLNNANDVSSLLFMLERKLNIILTSINNLLKEFEITKVKTMTARNKYNEAKASLDKIKENIEGKSAGLEKKLKTLEPTLDAALFKKYKSLRNDNVFPVFVPLVSENRCGYCRVELPSFKLDKIKNEEFIICEQCGRLIFNS